MSFLFFPWAIRIYMSQRGGANKKINIYFKFISLIFTDNSLSWRFSIEIGCHHKSDHFSFVSLLKIFQKLQVKQIFHCPNNLWVVPGVQGMFWKIEYVIFNIRTSYISHFQIVQCSALNQIEISFAMHLIEMKITRLQHGNSLYVIIDKSSWTMYLTLTCLMSSIFYAS